MGTRALTEIRDDGQTLVTIYRQMDGYPEGLGEELEAFLKDMTVVNGISDDKGKTANGMGCLAAQVIAHMKDGIGSVYIYPADSRDCGEEYIYTIELRPEGLHLTCHDVHHNNNVFEKYVGKNKVLP